MKNNHRHTAKLATTATSWPHVLTRRQSSATPRPSWLHQTACCSGKNTTRPHPPSKPHLPKKGMRQRKVKCCAKLASCPNMLGAEGHPPVRCIDISFPHVWYGAKKQHGSSEEGQKLIEVVVRDAFRHADVPIHTIGFHLAPCPLLLLAYGSRPAHVVHGPHFRLPIRFDTLNNAEPRDEPNLDKHKRGVPP